MNKFTSLITDENVTGQEQQTTNNTDNLEKMIKQIENKMMRTAVQDRADTFIGTIALLISLSLVIYGFQISRH